MTKKTKTVTSRQRFFDALAFRDGKIYMAFDGDLRIYEISPAPVPEPETYALMLAGLALIGLKLARR